MSLNQSQKRITSKELKENYEIASLPEEKVLYDLGFTKGQLLSALNMEESTNGYDVWKLRDYLLKVIKEQGKTPVPFSVLKVNIWFRY